MKRIWLGLFFLLLLLMAFLMTPSRQAEVVVPTATVTSTSTVTPVPSETPTVFILPTVTPLPPVVVVVTQVIVQEHTGEWDNSFYTGYACENAPVYSQPQPNWQLFIYKYYKNNQVEVTGESQFWTRVSLPSTGQVGYVPKQYVCR